MQKYVLAIRNRRLNGISVPLISILFEFTTGFVRQNEPEGDAARRALFADDLRAVDVSQEVPLANRIQHR